MSYFENPEHYENEQRSEKERQWNEKLEEVRGFVDELGKPIDEKIEETVAAFQVNGLPTRMSCEGHVDRALPHPWLTVEVPGRPKEQFVNEHEIKREVAEQYGLTIDELTQPMEEGLPQQAFEEASRRYMQNPYTEEFEAWRQKNFECQEKVRKLLDEFYEERETHDETRIGIEGGRGGPFRVRNGGAGREEALRSDENLNEEQKQNRRERLTRCQDEMHEFTEFLKEKFLTESEEETGEDENHST